MDKKRPTTKIVCFTFLLLLSLFSCELKEPPTSANPPPTFNPLPEKTGCNLGETNLFPLVEGSTPDVDYTFFLMTGNSPFYPEDCLCDVEQYELTFLDLPNANDIDLRNVDNGQLSFSIQALPNGRSKIIFTEPDELPDAEMSVYLNFLAGTAILEDAGGLCVIDNIDGLIVKPNSPQAAPIKYTLPPPPPTSDSVYRAFIPSNMAEPITP